MFTILPGTSLLYIVSQNGTLRTLTLPAGVTLSTARSRFATLRGLAFIVNGPTEAIWIDGGGTVRRLQVQKPVHPPVLADGGSTGYTGTRRAKVSFLIKDDLGNVLQESPLSDASDPVTVANKLIAYSQIPISSNPSVNARRVYVTATNGAVYFACFDLDDNTTTSYSDGASDEAIDQLAAPTDLGCAPPRISMIAEYRNRLAARSASDIDTLYLTTAGKIDTWTTTIPIGSKGADKYGITGFLSRRDEFGVGRRNSVWKIVGQDEDSFEPVRLIDGKGIITPDAALVIRDVGYFLAHDGVYKWDSQGVVSISDERVYPWFNTDDYFNRAQFENAFAGYDPRTNAYVLFLCSAGSTTIDRWVTYEIGSGRWMGPHKTGAFTPSAAAAGFDTSGNPVLIIVGTDGWLYSSQVGATASDGTTTAIEFDVLQNALCGEPADPDSEKLFGRTSVFVKEQSAGALSLIPHVGALDAPAGATIAIDLTLERQTTRHLGTGRLLQLRWLKTAADTAIDGIYGIKIPVGRLGRR